MGRPGCRVRCDHTEIIFRFKKTLKVFSVSIIQYASEVSFVAGEMVNMVDLCIRIGLRPQTSRYLSGHLVPKPLASKSLGAVP